MNGHELINFLVSQSEETLDNAVAIDVAGLTEWLHINDANLTTIDVGIQQQIVVIKASFYHGG